MPHFQAGRNGVMRINRRLLIAVLASAALVAAACGSTVPRSVVSGAAAPAAGTSPGAGNGGLSAPTVSSGSAAAAPPGSVTGSAGGGATGSGGTTSTGGSTTSGGGTTSGGTSGSGSQPSASAPGITATTIYLGADYTKNQEQGNAAIGGGGAGGGDARDYYNVMIHNVNSHGGIAGRKVVPIYAAFDATSSEPIDQQAQDACAKWTQDNKVFAILDGQLPIERQCAKNAGAADYWDPSGSNSVPETFRQYPNYVEITGLNLVRMGPVTIDGLEKQGYFDQGAKI